MGETIRDLSGYVTLTATESLRNLVRHALAEDIGAGDWTTAWTVPVDALGRGRIVAKEPLVVAGTEAAVEVFHALAPELVTEVLVPDGERVEEGGEVIRVEGMLSPILSAERTALNFLGPLSGIATLTRRFVDAVEGTGARIVDTRKTRPGWRLLEKAAVRAGGGANHRTGLFDMVLIKENHIEASGGLGRAVAGVHRRNEEGLLVEVEVRTLDELDEALAAGVERVLLDNMEVATLREAVRRRDRVGARTDAAPSDAPRKAEPPPAPAGRCQLEASGNVELSTVRSIAETGVDLVSVGALTHSAPVADLSLRVERLS